MNHHVRFFLPALALAALIAPASAAIGGCRVIVPDSTDAVAFAPEHHKVILENDAPHTAAFGQFGQIDRVDVARQAVGTGVFVDVDNPSQTLSEK